MVCHLESLLVAEREGGNSRCDIYGGAKTMGRPIWDRDDGKQWAEEVHQRLTVKVALCYTDNGVVDSTDPGWLQLVFNLLTGVFDWVGLRMNVSKTVGLVFRPCRAAVVWAD